MVDVEVRVTREIQLEAFLGRVDFEREEPIELLHPDVIDGDIVSGPGIA